MSTELFRPRDNIQPTSRENVASEMAMNDENEKIPSGKQDKACIHEMARLFSGYVEATSMEARSGEG